jgi:exopolysaccharide biosynthesis polyprenyl glycosylphosphotransferase
VWPAAIEALASAKRDADVLGWFKQGSVLGVILPELGGHSIIAHEVKGRMRRELDARFDSETVAKFSIRLHVYSGAGAATVAHDSPKETLLLRLPHRANQNPLRDVVKRCMDIVGSMALLTVLSPLFLLVSALVKLTSPGPIFFRQTRVGRMGRPFIMLKFRTMYVNADESVHQKYVSEYIKSGASAAGAGSEAPFKLVNDARVTRLGNVLRKTSLDELPQFWNVLRGHMSLVGPRPPLPYEIKEYKAWHYRRVLDAKPGMTGLWQVTGRSSTTFDEMVRLDLRYVRTRSLWTDIKILLATPRAVFSGKGAS